MDTVFRGILTAKCGYFQSNECLLHTRIMCIMTGRWRSSTRPLLADRRARCGRPVASGGVGVQPLGFGAAVALLLP